MLRIDSANARQNVNGEGKAGFHDNTDLAGHDPTYLTPEWCNAIQEELANLLELNGVPLNQGDNTQLFNLLATEESLLALSTAIETRLQQLKQQQEASDSTIQTQLYDALESLQQQISNLSNSLATSYPKVLLSGVIKAGQPLEITKPTAINMSFLDTRYAVQLTPEGGHEAWSLTRHDDKIAINIWNRSGTNRIGYTGNINWSVIQTEGLTASAGNGDYIYTGTPVVFPILAGESKSFLLIGAGGGGGSSRYEDLAANSNPPPLKGQDGEATYLSITGTNIVFSAGGGGGGVGGIDGGQGQFIDGIAGGGGEWSMVGAYTSATRTNGQAGNANADNHTGASTDSNGRGSGGDGADGYLIETQAFGGGGGEGARLSVIYTNNTQSTQYARLYVGQAGQGEKSLLEEVNTGTYLAGSDGSNGFARVSTTV